MTVVRNNRQYIILISFIIFSSFISNADSLWEKAVKIYSENKHLQATEMTMLIEELNKHGDTKNEEVQNFMAKNIPTRLFDYTLISAYKNGKDITEKKLKKRARNETVKEPPFDYTASPFDLNLQNSVSFQKTDLEEIKFGQLCIKFEFKQNLSNKLKSSGYAWLNKKTGAPVYMKYKISDIPWIIKNVNMSVKFIYVSPTNWYIDYLQFDGIAKILFIKKYYRTTLKFFNYSNIF